MKLLAALLVVAHAAAQFLPDINTTCLLAGSKIAGDTEKKAELLIAAGKDFPLDSGRFSFCQSIPGNRYFLITFNASWNNSNPPKFVPSGIQSGSSQFHPELGLCLPDVCDDHDAGVLTMMALNKVESVNQTSANPAARAIEAWAGPAGYGAGGTPHSSWAAGFNMTVWRVKVRKKSVWAGNGEEVCVRGATGPPLLLRVQRPGRQAAGEGGTSAGSVCVCVCVCVRVGPPSVRPSDLGNGHLGMDTLVDIERSGGDRGYGIWYWVSAWLCPSPANNGVHSFPNPPLATASIYLVSPHPL